MRWYIWIIFQCLKNRVAKKMDWRHAFYTWVQEGVMGDEKNKTGVPFDGLDMESLTGGPLKAACDAQAKLAETTAEFIRSAGLESSGSGDVKTATFTFRKKGADESDDLSDREVSLKVPFLAIVPIPSLAIEDIDVNFDMDVNSYSEQAVAQKQDGERKD